jgi:hypothetical protein
MYPVLEAMTEDNWMEIKAQLLEFSDRGQVDR